MRARTPLGHWVLSSVLSPLLQIASPREMSQVETLLGFVFKSVASKKSNHFAIPVNVVS